MSHRSTNANARWKRALVSISMLLGIAGVVPALAAAAADPAARPPERAGRREPWLTSRITGSPDPAPPYRVERAFPNLQFSEPVELVPAPGSDRFFLVQLHGKILSFPLDPAGSRADLFLDLAKLHPDLTMTYGLAFHPKFQSNGYVYVCYVLKDGTPDGSRVSRFAVEKTDPPKLDPASEQVVITWLAGGHNGGSIHFGPDGDLYISTGDGRGPDPPDSLNTGQDLSDLLSSILRIDVDRVEGGKPYGVPADNPFRHTPGARPEVWCYGLRNPWRMSFDSQSGDLWVGDVGWELWEMIDRVQRGANYGWSIIEGKQIIKPDGKRGPTPIVPPTVVHPHSEAASITGGYVYHGKRFPELGGAYLYGDYVTGRIWALRYKNGEVTWHQELARSGLSLVAFGQDPAGELYLVDHGAGTLHRLAHNSTAASPAHFPRKLSETGLFADVARNRMAPGVVPYSINSELWNDGALAERQVALPGDSTIITTNGWRFPKDTVLAKTLSLEMERGRPASRRRIETQILHLSDDGWNAYTYRWNDAQTDGELVESAGAQQTFAIVDRQAPGGVRRQTWRFYSRAECLRCHNPWCGVLLGFNLPQLNRDQARQAAEPQPGHASTAAVDNQLRGLARTGVFDQIFDSEKTPRLADPRDRSANLTDRARSYLHVNCSHCHREHAGGSVLVFMNYDWPLERTGLVGAKPTQGNFGMRDAQVIFPGDPYRSVLYYRISKLGRSRMPYLGSGVVDTAGVALIGDWIQQMRPGPVADAGGPAKVEPERAEEAAALRALGANVPAPAKQREAAADRLLNSVSGALQLLRAIDEGVIGSPMRETVLRKATADPNPLIRDLFERFVPEEKRVQVLGTDINPQAILSLGGDVDRGRALFFQEGGAQCHTCHRIQGTGRNFGPDLSQIGRKYHRAQILENILQPSKTIDPKFVAYAVDTQAGMTYTGFLVRKSTVEVVLKTLNEDEFHIRTAEVTRLEPQRLSLMPEGLLQSLTAQQAADLVAFLSSLR